MLIDSVREWYKFNHQDMPTQIKNMKYDLIEHHWHVSVLFSLFNAKTFCKLLTAILLEKSIIFVDGNPNVVSSVIFALKTLIRPF